ncbi:LysR family transcriptional regulator [Rhodobacterales bacterium LSUCC0031]|nr:LysR family transcriptional regulator [Rhodobacterales bacterium LSUCC0031]
MDLIDLRCFLMVAEELHFGRAARRLEMLPASLGRRIAALEDRLGTVLIHRTTRAVTLSQAGHSLVAEARDLICAADAFVSRARSLGRDAAPKLRIGAIDSAAAGLLPQILPLFRNQAPDIQITLDERKTIQLVPRLLSGRIDLALIRPPERRDPRLKLRALLSESTVVALPLGHPLARMVHLTVDDLADAPLIVPDRQSRPHSHDLTIKLMHEAGHAARIAQVAEEKHTIVSLVAAGLGLAIVPRWSALGTPKGVVFRPLLTPEGQPIRRLHLAAAWCADVRDGARDALLDCLEGNLVALAASA